MGYTHYFRIEKPLAKKEFKLLVADARKLIKAGAKRGILLADGHGLIGTSPSITVDAIIFNGMDYSEKGGEDGSHETLYLPQKAEGFNFCKTARKEYDLVVVAVLIALKKHFPSTEISSDGDSDDWKEGVRFCQEVLGYGENFDISEGDFDDDEREVLTREEAIDDLVSSELDTIRQEVIQDRVDYLTGLIKNGVTGFANLSDDDLEDEFRNAFDREVKIKG